MPIVAALVLGPLMLGAGGAAGAANGQVCMGVVIDDGPNSSEQNGAPVATQAAQVPPGTSDLQALSAAGDTATQNNSGLVCAINDFPADGLQDCLSTDGNGQYFYWSYWEGDPYTNTWTYANVGPASHTVSAGQTYVEGWRYQDPGADNPSATKPSVSPATAFAQACPGVAPVPSGGSGTGGGSGGGDSGGGGSGGGGSSGTGAGSSSGPVGSSAATTTTTVAGPGSAPRTAPGATTSSGSNTTTSHPGPGAVAAPGSSTTTTVAGSGARHRDAATALADSRRHGGAGGGDPALPIVIVAVVILALGGLAWWRWRQRPLEE